MRSEKFITSSDFMNFANGSKKRFTIVFPETQVESGQSMRVINSTILQNAFQDGAIDRYFIKINDSEYIASSYLSDFTLDGTNIIRLDCERQGNTILVEERTGEVRAWTMPELTIEITIFTFYPPNIV